MRLFPDLWWVRIHCGREGDRPRSAVVVAPPRGVYPCPSVLDEFLGSLQLPKPGRHAGGGGFIALLALRASLFILPLMRLLCLALLISIAEGSYLTATQAADQAPGAGSQKANSLIDSPEAALRKFRVAPGLKADFYAAEPDVRNPVAFSINEQGRVFVVESDRRRSSVFDIRGHKDWLEADFSFRTVQDRADFLKQQVSPTNPAAIKRLTGNGGNGSFADFNKDGVTDWRDLEVQTERIRLLEDTNGDGRADRASIFAEGFTNRIAGVAAGVLAHGDDVYFACIPDLWKFSKTNSAAARTPLLSGFGVHIAFGGHDMHGLIMGPDGKLYWSIADRGVDTNLFARIKNPIPGLTPELLADSGCVFRANPDGSDFEVIAWGLRNPQELAFDELGNLFTADNNGDGGDKARWHYVVEGADFGWRLGWQWHEARAYQPKMGPWNGERLWHLAESNTAAYLLPPLAHIGHGPAGLAYNPGTGLPAKYARHFLMCDFPGDVLMWTNIADGASFRIGSVQSLVGDLGPTDVAFHPDGGVLVSDWFKTFDKTDMGRLYRIHDPATDASPAVQEVKRLLAEGMGRRSARELAKLLDHPDLRVRQQAQFALAKVENFGRLSRIASGSGNRLARIHAIFALSQIVESQPRTEFVKELESLVPLLKDPDAEIRAQAARLMGKGRLLAAQAELDALFHDPEPRVQMFAMFAYRDLFMGFGGGGGHRHRLSALDSLKERVNRLIGSRYFDVSGPSLTWPMTSLKKALSNSKPAEPFVLHAAVSLLSQIGKISGPIPFRPTVNNFATNAPFSARMAVVQAYRRLEDSSVASFLSDGDANIALEAARAINDVPIIAAMPDLARLIVSLPPAFTNLSSETAFFFYRRVLNGNFRLGAPTNAVALATFAARKDVPEPLRIEALELLALWPNPPARDHFMGLYRPLPPRDGKPAEEALSAVAADLLADGTKEVKLAAFRAADSLNVVSVDLAGLVANAEQPMELRVEALRALARRKDPRLESTLASVESDRAEVIRLEVSKLRGGGDVAGLVKLLDNGSIAERRSALNRLAAMSGPEVDVNLVRQLDTLMAGTVAKELQLDVLEAAAKRPALQAKLADWNARLPKDDALASFRPALFGGDAAEGRKLFIENQQIACFRCHKINGEGGDVGPDLTGLGEKKGREYLLESIVQPNRQIAAGYENVLLTMNNGAEYAGLVKSETDAELVLNSPEDGVMTLKKVDIKTRLRGLSAMPEDLIANLSKRELRDLIEFLAVTN